MIPDDLEYFIFFKSYSECENYGTFSVFWMKMQSLFSNKNCNLKNV